MISKDYLSNLTPLRGIAALLVAIFHFQSAIARFVPVKVTLFLQKSYVMVDLFFIMSGFIIFHVYGTHFRERISKLSFRKFIIARFARIYPLHFVSLLLLIVIVLLFSPAGTWPNRIEAPMAIPTNFLLLQSFGIHTIYTWNIPSWSISAEWWSYLLFPLIALFIGRQKKLAVPLLLLGIIAAYLSIMFLLPRKNPLYPLIPVPHDINTTFDYGWLRGLAGFTSGVLLYLLYQLPSAKKLFRKDWITGVTLLLMVVDLHFGWSDGFTIIIFALTVIGFACNDGTIQKICNARPLQFIGNISYSIYLMQIFFQEPFQKGLRLPGTSGFGRGKQTIDFWPGLGYCLLYLLLLIGVSTITYYCIELPCRKWINKSRIHNFPTYAPASS